MSSEDIKYIEEINELKNSNTKLEDAVKFLWELLDDIDTVSDIAKSDNEFYRSKVERIQELRWQSGIECDGYVIKIDLQKLCVPYRPDSDEPVMVYNAGPPKTLVK